MTGLMRDLGPMVGGIALVFAAAAAWTTFFLYYRRSLQDAWKTTFRQTYAEFWKDPDAAQARHMITNDSDYLRVEPILKARLTTDSNNLSDAENIGLETIDRFCALLTRIHIFERATLDKEQKKIWDSTYGTYWIAEIRKREALKQYIERFWPGLKPLMLT